MPQGMVERAAEWTEDSVPSPAVPAASVILLRDGDNRARDLLVAPSRPDALRRHRWWSFPAGALIRPIDD